MVVDRFYRTGTDLRHLSTVAEQDVIMRELTAASEVPVGEAAVTAELDLTEDDENWDFEGMVLVEEVEKTGLVACYKRSKNCVPRSSELRKPLWWSWSLCPRTS